jgi:hypothetical protein
MPVLFLLKLASSPLPVKTISETECHCAITSKLTKTECIVPVRERERVLHESDV